VGKGCTESFRLPVRPENRNFRYFNVRKCVRYRTYTFTPERTPLAQNAKFDGKMKEYVVSALGTLVGIRGIVPEGPLKCKTPAATHNE
jgi:hypothetical protein